MSLAHAILGFLNYEPMSGYDLKKAFDVSVQHFWPADQSQIYRTLQRLEDEGWAEAEVVKHEDRPDRRVYRITAEGAGELRQWLTRPLQVKAPRSPQLIQVFFAGQLDDEEILPFFERGIAAQQGLLAHLEQVPELSRPYQEQLGTPRDVFFWLLTLECGMHLAQAQLEWMESVVSRIRAKAHPAPADVSED